jgi:hypothetical protein
VTRARADVVVIGARWLLLTGSLLAGLLLAVLTIQRAGAWTRLFGLEQ